MAKRIDRDNEPYRPILSISREKTEELFGLINMMDTQQMKQFSMINSITLNVESSATGDNLMHKVLTLNNSLKKEFHRLNMIKFLYQNGVNPDKPNRENQTPLHLACKEQYFSIVEFLISIGVDLNFKDNIGFTPLHYALMGKIELYDEVLEINDFIEKPKKIDFDKKDKLITVKKAIWDKIKASPFIEAISKTIDISIYSDGTINNEVLGFVKKISENILKINKSDSIKLIREQVNMLKKNIENLVKEKWGEFRDITELEIHYNEIDSFILQGNELSPLKNINVKKDIKDSSKKAKNDIKDNCKKIQDEADIDVPVNKLLNDIYVKFYKEFVDTNTDLFNNVIALAGRFSLTNTTMKLDKNIVTTNWNNFNKERMHSLAIDFADNIINWDDMTFIGGSREITINYDFETIKTILSYKTIEERVFHILAGLDRISMTDFYPNNIDLAKLAGVNIITNELDIIYKKLPYYLIFKKPINIDDFPLSIRFKEELIKWKSLFEKNEFASVLYNQICWSSCLRDLSTDNLTGTIYSEACALALAVKINNGMLTNEFLETTFKKYHISIVAQSAATPYYKICGMINILLTNKLDVEPDTYINDAMTKQNIKDCINELIIAKRNYIIFVNKDQPKIDFTTKKNKLIKIIMDEVNLMIVKPIESDILQIITFISNSFEEDDITFFNLNENVYLNIFPLIPDGDKYSDETINNYINKIIYIIKERQTTMLIPYIYHLLEIFNVKRAEVNYELHSLKKLNEARHLGLYYKGLIPYLTSISSVIIDKHTPDLQPKKIINLKPHNWSFGLDNKLTNQDIPLIGNYVGDMAPARPIDLTHEQKLNYYSFVLSKCRPPLNESVKILSERNKHYLIIILSKLTSNKDNDNSLINLIDSNSRLAKVFTDIYPIMNVLGDLINFENNDKIEKLISSIITNINKYNSYILLYYYLMNKEKLFKIPKFNYYEIPQLGKTGKFLYFDDNNNELDLTGSISLNIPDNPYNPESTIPSVNTGLIYNRGAPLFRRLIRILNINIYKDKYLIKKESLVRSKKSGLPPSIASILPEFYKYNLLLLLKEEFEYYFVNQTDPIYTDIEIIKNDLDVTNNNVLTYFTIGKIIEELISEHSKDYIQKQSLRIITKLLKKINIDDRYPLLTDIAMIVKSDDFSLTLNNTNLTPTIRYIEPIDAFNLYQFSKEDGLPDDNCIFIIYPDEYANSELLSSKYKLTLNKDIYKKLLENNANPYLLDLNNQSAVFPILKIHNYSIVKELKMFIDYREYSDVNALQFLTDEYNNHFNLLANKETNFKKWMSNFVIYQKNEVKTLILSNDKFGNNVPNYLEDSFEVVFYLASQYLSESVNKMPDVIQEKIKTEFNYTIDFKKYLFINEKLSDVFISEKDNFLQDLIDAKLIEIKKIKRQYDKLNDGLTKKTLKAKESEINREIEEYKKLMALKLIDRKNLDNSKILNRYYELNYVKGTMTRALSKLIKSDKLNDSFDLFIFKFYNKEFEKINNIKSVKTIDTLYTDFYEYTNNLSEIYFTFGNYLENNKVLQFSVELLIFMTKYFIIFPYIIILKKALYSYFQSIYPNFSFVEINDRIDYCFKYEYVYGDKLNKLEDHLYLIITDKLVKNSVRKFKNKQEELEFESENISEILDNIVNLFTINPIMPIPANSKFFNNMKEINAYFDTFTVKTISNWLVVIENTFKFNINQGRIVKCIHNLIL